MDRATLERLDGLFYAARLVQGVGVNGDGNVVLFGYGEAVIDGGRRCAPVFV